MLVRFGCAALIACASFSTMSLAEPARGNAEVRYSDLDLSTPAGVKALHKRVDRAATAVCVDLNGYAADQRSAVDMCRKLALSRAKPALEIAVADAKSSKQLAQNTINLSDR